MNIKLRFEYSYAWVNYSWPILLGILALYIPVYFQLFNGLWQKSDFAHGPIVLMVVIYLFWEKRHLLETPVVAKKASLGNTVSQAICWICIVFGLLIYIVGKSQDIIAFSVGSQMIIFSALILMIFGLKTLKAFWLPIFFIFFMIPLPSFVVDVITVPMKIAVSEVAEQLLYSAGYPIARSGVVLHMGQYQLLVADACAGMHTLISLEALGLLYLSLVKHDSLFRNITLATLIIPISFTANVIRVITLVLITYYFGDEVGQGFVHGFAGMLLFIVALIIIMTVDSLLQRWVARKTANPI